jgi:hypothetical protein
MGHCSRSVFTCNYQVDPGCSLKSTSSSPAGEIATYKYCSGPLTCLLQIQRTFSSSQHTGMPPLGKKRAEEVGEYDAFYIGGGSGGIASAVSPPGS